MKEYPLPTVGGIVVAPDGDILLVRSHKWNDMWTIPGGKIEMGESTHNAVIREIKEETNLDVSDVRLINIQDCIFSPEFYIPRHFIFHDFVCRIAKNENKNDVILNDEAQEYAWVTPEKAAQYALTKQMRYLLNRYMDQKK